jgi:hypothetical protein
MIPDDDLLLFHWQDGLDDTRRREIADALVRDAELGARYARLVADLTRFRHVPELQVDAVQQARWMRAIREAQRPPRSSPRRHWPLALAAGIAALAVFAPIGRPPQVDPSAPSPMPMATMDRGDEARVARGVRVHLAEAGEGLSQWSTQPEATRRALVQRWIDDQRALAQAADAAGDAQLARTLRAFEPLLRDLANDAPQAANAEREQLAFEWSVMQTKLAASQSKPSPSGI